MQWWFLWTALIGLINSHQAGVSSGQPGEEGGGFERPSVPQRVTAAGAQATWTHDVTDEVDSSGLQVPTAETCLLSLVLSNNKEELNVALRFRVDEFDYTVYDKTDSLKCFGCGEGHVIQSCLHNVEDH